METQYCISCRYEGWPLGPKWAPCSSPVAADHKIEMAEIPNSLVPIGVFPGDEPIPVIILKHTDRANVYARLEALFRVACLIGRCLAQYMSKDTKGRDQN